MQDYLSIANSPILFIICGVLVVLTIIQAILFLRVSIKESGNSGIPKETVKKVIVNSAIFSILPSLPILITLAVLMPILGKYLPWLRLSVIGSAMYESMAADITIKSFGLGGLGAGGITPSIFVSIIWVMFLAILVGPILNVLFLKSYYNKLTVSKTSGGFLALATGSFFVGMLSIMTVPHVFNFSNPIGIVVVIVAGVFSVLLDKVAKTTGKSIIGEFSFPLSMLIGMFSAVLVGGLF